MNRSISTLGAKQHFQRLLSDVDHGDQIVITKQGKPTAVLINFEQLETLRAVGLLWQDPEALLAMRRSFADSKTGKVLRLTGAPTVRRILSAARKKGLLTS